MSEITIREVNLNDAEELVNIYAPYVLNTAITFEYEIPSIETFRQRMIVITESYPYLVALIKGEIIGYAYASTFNPRAAYQWSAEVSVYLKQERQGTGAGKMLYQELEHRLKKQNIKNLNACIAYPNERSIAFHEKMGFKTIGHFHQCGFKLNQWWDMVWMEKMIADHDLNVKPFRKINTL